MIEARCGNCRRLLARGAYDQIEIKCPRCRAINIFNHPKAGSLLVERRGASDEPEVSHAIHHTPR